MNKNDRAVFYGILQNGFRKAGDSGVLVLSLLITEVMEVLRLIVNIVSTY